MTPEGKVKKQVKDLLKVYAPACWSYSPVETGFGTRAVDILGVYNGKGFAIECKAGNNPPTARQQQTLAEIAEAGGATFVINGDLTALKTWLEMTRK